MIIATSVTQLLKICTESVGPFSVAKPKNNNKKCGPFCRFNSPSHAPTDVSVFLCVLPFLLLKAAPVAQLAWVHMYCLGPEMSTTSKNFFNRANFETGQEGERSKNVCTWLLYFGFMSIKRGTNIRKIRNIVFLKSQKNLDFSAFYSVLPP